MITAAELTGLMTMMPAFATDDAGDLKATNTVSVPRMEAGLNRMIGDGANVIATTGSFGECHTLSLEEFETLAVAATEIVNRRVPLFIGVTSLNTRDVIRKMEIVAKTNAAGVLVGVPFYFPASPDVAVGFYRDISEMFPKLGIMVYHNPPLHHVKLDLTIMEQLLALPNIVAMKDSHRTPIEFMQLMEIARGKMSVFVNQMQYSVYGPLGAAGMWSIQAWMGPWPHLALRDAVMSGDVKRAAEITLELAPPPSAGGMNLSWRETLLKVAIRHAGYVDPGPTRPPFQRIPPEMDAAQRKKAERWKITCGRYTSVTA